MPWVKQERCSKAYCEVQEEKQCKQSDLIEDLVFPVMAS